jgi:outer membrane lipoprotein SlyB
MKKLLACLALALGLLGCASTGNTSPEAQIATGANALTATTTLATVALRNDKITVAQAKSFRVMLGAASTSLDDANTVLLACRKATGTTAATASDPCAPQVTDVIRIALDTIANVKTALDRR